MEEEEHPGAIRKRVPDSLMAQFEEQFNLALECFTAKSYKEANTEARNFLNHVMNHYQVRSRTKVQLKARARLEQDMSHDDLSKMSKAEMDQHLDNVGVAADQAYEQQITNKTVRKKLRQVFKHMAERVPLPPVPQDSPFRKYRPDEDTPCPINNRSNPFECMVSIKIAGDGNCLLRSILYSLDLGYNYPPNLLRVAVVHTMFEYEEYLTEQCERERNGRGKSFNLALLLMMTPEGWLDATHAEAVSICLNMPIILYYPVGLINGILDKERAMGALCGFFCPPGLGLLVRTAIAQWGCMEFKYDNTNIVNHFVAMILHVSPANNLLYHSVELINDEIRSRADTQGNPKATFRAALASTQSNLAGGHRELNKSLEKAQNRVRDLEQVVKNKEGELQELSGHIQDSDSANSDMTEQYSQMEGGLGR